MRCVEHALRRGVTRRSDLVIVSDGAAWIATLCDRHFPQAVKVRDWWHTVQYLWQASQALYGEGTEATQRLVSDLKSLLWEGNLLPLRERLEREYQEAPPRHEERQEAFRKALGYLESQAEALRYPDYREANWPIGSGPVEATCKMIQARMKRSGMNWSPTGAEHLLFLRAEYCSRLNAILYPQS